MKIQLLTTCAMTLLYAGIAAAEQPELPPLKEGLWEFHTTMIMQGGKHESTLKVCRTHQTDKAVKQQSKATGENLRKARQCTDTTTQQSASSYSSESRCAKDGSVTKTTITLQGDTSYHLEMRRKDNQFVSLAMG